MSSLPPMRRAITPEPEMLSNSVSFPYEPLFYPSALYKSYSKPVWGNPVEAAPIRTTSVSYAGTSPWSSTGFYYSPRYPEAYRGNFWTFLPAAPAQDQQLIRIVVVVGTKFWRCGVLVPLMSFLLLFFVVEQLEFLALPLKT